MVFLFTLTGNSITLPSERYIINGNIYTEYTNRNGYRMIPYHRLDFGAIYKPKKVKSLILHGIFQYIIYTTEKILTSYI